ARTLLVDLRRRERPEPWRDHLGRDGLHQLEDLVRGERHGRPTAQPARLDRRKASARQTRSNSARCRPSLAPWARVSGSSTPVTRTLASGNASRNSAMNGIDPPTPMSTGAVPSQASVNAVRAASYAGPVASIWVASPVSTTVWVSVAPQGTWAPRWATSRSSALAVVSPGAIRS